MTKLIDKRRRKLVAPVKGDKNCGNYKLIDESLTEIACMMAATAEEAVKVTTFEEHGLIRTRIHPLGTPEAK